MNALIAISAVGVMVAMFIAYKIYTDYLVYLRPGYVRARIRCKDRRLISMYTPFSEKTNKFRFRGLPYSIDPKCIEREGIMRVPTLIYLEGISNPVYLGEDKISLGGVSAQDFKDALESHVGRDLIKAFMDDGISITTSVVILVCIMVVGFAAIFYTNHKNQQDLIEQIQIATGYQAPQQPVLDTVPGVTTHGEK